MVTIVLQFLLPTSTMSNANANVLSMSLLNSSAGYCSWVCACAVRSGFTVERILHKDKLAGVSRLQRVK